MDGQTSTTTIADQSAGAEAAPPDHAEQPASAQLFMLLASKWLVQSVYCLAKLGVADQLADGPLEVAELAARTGTHAPSLRRVLRATAVVNIFTELPDGRYALTPQADCLRTDAVGTLRPFAMFIGDDALWRPYGDMVETVRTGEPAFDRVHGMTVYDYLHQHPPLAAVFDDAMTALSEESAHLYLKGHDFGRYGTIADVGGGRGMMLAAILQQHPGTKGILFDLAHVVAEAAPTLDRAGVADRVTVVPGDFFGDIPAGADAYLLKTVLQNWNDDKARQILRRVRAAIGADTSKRLLILEDVIQPLNTWDVGKLVDIDMMVTVGGRERTFDEWRELLASASFALAPQSGGTEWMVLEASPV
jgi:multifunctional cyclase/dehydratase/O-methyltransferase